LLGEATAGILQRAHETADEIAARSRAQADGRLQRAEREAEIVKRDADEYAEQVVADTRLLWDERQRLIEDIRHLADVVLGTADDAMERLKLPEPLAAAEQEAEEAGGGANVTPIPHPLSIARDPEPDPQSDPSVPYDLELPVEEDPDATVAWGVGREQDPETTAAWPEEGEEDPETTAPYPAEDEYADEEGEQDPDATAAYAVAGEQDPDPTAPYVAEDEYAGEDDELSPLHHTFTLAAGEQPRSETDLGDGPALRQGDVRDLLGPCGTIHGRLRLGQAGGPQPAQLQEPVQTARFDAADDALRPSP
jgi:hypothetical protein